jgi:hypothetical protein
MRFIHSEIIIPINEQLSGTSAGARSLVGALRPQIPRGGHKPGKSAQAAK